MTIEGHVLLLESLDGGSNKLAERMMAFGIDPILVPSIEDAHDVLAQHRVAITAVMIPTDIPAHQLKKDLKRLSRIGPASGLTFVSVGKSPVPSERKKLRAAGLTLALWEPYDDGTLRFQLNRAMGGDRNEHGRKSRRAPTYLLARIFVGGRTKDAVVYSLSKGGAFLETPRASMDGAMVEVELRLPANHIRVQGLVIFCNVPGNLQRPNLPLGMGIRFENITPDEAARISSYVDQRIAELDV